MAFLVSPGVQVKEIDMTNVIPATSASIGATVGSFQWGPINQPINVGSEQQLVETFGQPNDDTFSSFLTAAQFLSYGDLIKVIRVVGTGALNATTGAAGVLLNSMSDMPAEGFAGKYPGTVANGLVVEICPPDATIFNSWSYSSSFNGAPTGDDEMHVVVVDKVGTVTGTPDTVLESFSYVSQAVDAKSVDGTSNYVVNVINNTSLWINMATTIDGMVSLGSPLLGTTFDTTLPVTNYSTATVPSTAFILANGASVVGSAGNVITGYDLFEDAETIEVSLIVDGSGDALIAKHITSICEARKDCMAFVSPAVSDTVNTLTPLANVKAWRDTVDPSSYAVADSGALYVYDKYNDVYRWITASGVIGGLCAYTDSVADPWFSPAGFNRGNLHNVVKLAYNPKQVDRDELYKLGVNPIVSFPGQGTILYGDKTLQVRASAFDRINVRRLFIILEKAISRASKASLFELNDEFTRAQFMNMVEPFLRDVKGRRGITDFKVVCDETNNTGSVIDTNRFVADIYIKPARSINFITLNFVATRTGVEFSEIAGGN